MTSHPLETFIQLMDKDPTSLILPTKELFCTRENASSPPPSPAPFKLL